jgi:hypothetical protein
MERNMTAFARDEMGPNFVELHERINAIQQNT